MIKCVLSSYNIINITIAATIFLLLSYQGTANARVRGCGNSESFNRSVEMADEGSDAEFFVFEIKCENRAVIESGFGPGLSVTATNLKEKVLYFRYNNGFSSKIEMSERRLVDSMYKYIDVTIFKDGVFYQKFGSSSNLFASVANPDCSFRHGDGGFEDSVVDISYPSGLAAPLMELANRYGWQAAIYVEYGKILPRNELFLSGEFCENGMCNLMIDVGVGNEFFAVSAFNKFDRRVCAGRIGAGAGSPPIQVAGIPLRTLVDPESVGAGGVSEVVQRRILDRLFDKRVMITPARASSQNAKSVNFSILGPNNLLGINFHPGYWYKADVNFSIGINVYGGDVEETVQITILNLKEIYAPESLSNLPDGIIKSGREIEYLNSDGERSEYADVLDQWSVALATKVINITGGFIIGGG